MNLYLQIHPVGGPLGSATAIVDQNGTLRAEWLAVLARYPDRAVLGTDTFYAASADDARGAAEMQSFLAQLPTDLAQRLGCENPVVI